MQNQELKKKYEAPTLAEKAFLTSHRKYLFFTLLHELGHTFGLADVYGGQDKFGTSGITKSTGGNKDTVGSNPLSIMAAFPFWKVTGFHYDVELTLDDEEGIKWLYTYHHRPDSVSPTSCPEGYKYEKRSIDYDSKKCVGVDSADETINDGENTCELIEKNNQISIWVCTYPSCYLCR